MHEILNHFLVLYTAPVHKAAAVFAMTAGLGFPSHVCLQHHLSSCHPLHHCKGTNAFPAKQGSDILFLFLSSAGQALGIRNRALRSIVSSQEKNQQKKLTHRK